MHVGQIRKLQNHTTPNLRKQVNAGYFAGNLEENLCNYPRSLEGNHDRQLHDVHMYTEFGQIKCGLQVYVGSLHVTGCWRAALHITMDCADGTVICGFMVQWLIPTEES